MSYCLHGPYLLASHHPGEKGGELLFQLTLRYETALGEPPSSHTLLFHYLTSPASWRVQDVRVSGSALESLTEAYADYFTAARAALAGAEPESEGGWLRDYQLAYLEAFAEGDVSRLQRMLAELQPVQV